MKCFSVHFCLIVANFVVEYFIETQICSGGVMSHVRDRGLIHVIHNKNCNFKLTGTRFKNVFFVAFP